MANKDTAKPWFLTGLFPTQAQFHQVFDWLRWKDEALAISDVTGLQTILNGLSNPIQKYTSDGSDFNYTVQAGFILNKILIKPAVDCKPSCEFVGTSEPDDIFSALDISPTNGGTYTVEIWASEAGRDIVIKDLPTDSTLYFIRTKLP